MGGLGLPAAPVYAGSVLAVGRPLPEDPVFAIRYHDAPTKDPFHRSFAPLSCRGDALADRGGVPSTVGKPMQRRGAVGFGPLASALAILGELASATPADFAASDLPA